MTLRPTRSTVVLQLGGWLGVAAIYFALDMAAQDEPRVAELVVRAAVWGGCGWLCSLMAWWSWARLRPEQWSPARVVLASAVGGLVFGTAWLIGFNGIDAAVALEPGYIPLAQWGSHMVLSEGLTYVFPMMAWHAVAFSLRQIERGADDRARAAEAEQLAQRAALDALRYQLNPHLLFNALNSTMALITDDPAKAERMLQHLSGLLRSTLEAPREGTVAEELARISTYLELEQVRFESRLAATIEVDPALRHALLPTLLIQPLVENAIKHGMREAKLELSVRISVAATADGMRIEVANSGTLASDTRPIDASQDIGVGLTNVRARVAAHYGDEGTLQLSETSDDDGPWTVARLVLPARSGARQEGR